MNTKNNVLELLKMALLQHSVDFVHHQHLYRRQIVQMLLTLKESTCKGYLENTHLYRFDQRP